MVNRDHELVRSFITSGDMPVRIACNPLMDALGASLVRYDAKSRSIDVCFETVGSAYRQGAGVILGGIVAVMLDTAMAFAAMTGLELGTAFATTSLTTNFLGAARSDRYLATARIQKAGRRIVFLEAMLSATSPATAVASPALVATATSSILVSA